MKYYLPFVLSIARFVLSDPQLPVPPGTPPPLPQVPTATPLPVPATPAIPIPGTPLPPGPGSSTTDPAPPEQSAPDDGRNPICECGFTYCSSVLMAMDVPWTQAELTDAYCQSPNAVCDDGSPSTDVKNALFVCLCPNTKARTGHDLDLLCGCDKCLVVGPDYRGRCATPCASGSGGRHAKGIDQNALLW